MHGRANARARARCACAHGGSARAALRTRPPVARQWVAKSSGRAACYRRRLLLRGAAARTIPRETRTTAMARPLALGAQCASWLGALQRLTPASYFAPTRASAFACNLGVQRKPRNRADKPVKKIDEVCNNYLAGKCRSGEQCRRQHIGEIQQTVEKIDEVCNNFLAGRCRFGELCRRQHVDSA